MTGRSLSRFSDAADSSEHLSSIPSRMDAVARMIAAVQGTGANLVDPIIVDPEECKPRKYLVLPSEQVSSHPGECYFRAAVPSRTCRACSVFTYSPILYNCTGSGGGVDFRGRNQCALHVTLGPRECRADVGIGLAGRRGSAAADACDQPESGW